MSFERLLLLLQKSNYMVTGLIILNWIQVSWNVGGLMCYIPAVCSSPLVTYYDRINCQDALLLQQFQKHCSRAQTIQAKEGSQNIRKEMQKHSWLSKFLKLQFKKERISTESNSQKSKEYLELYQITKLIFNKKQIHRNYPLFLM